MIRAWLGYASYWIRPYDMLADARRWRWQRRTPCRVIVSGPVAEAVARMLDDGH